MPALPASPTRTNHAVRLTRLVHDRAAVTRQTIAEATGMSPSLVSRVAADLIRAGVLEAQPQQSGERPGRPSERLRIDATAGISVGAEVGGERAMLVVCDATGARVAEEAFSGGYEPVTRDGLDALAERVRRFAGRHTNEQVPLQGVGVAFHDAVTSDGYWLRKGDRASAIPARDLLERRLGVPVRTDDVSRAFAEAEHRFGAGRDAPDMLYLFLGREGVGSGIFVGDALLRSSTGICGEIGHLPVEPDGRRCSCGNVGCLETVATHGAMLERARDYLDQGVQSGLDADAGFPHFLEAARRGDKVATLVVHDLVEHLQTALTGAISVTGATTVVLGGDVRASGPSLPELLTAALRRSLLQPLAERTHVRYAELPASAGAWGAAVGVLEDVLRDGSLVRRRLDGEGVAMNR